MVGWVSYKIRMLIVYDRPWSWWLKYITMNLVKIVYVNYYITSKNKLTNKFELFLSSKKLFQMWIIFGLLLESLHKYKYVWKNKKFV